MNKENFGDYLPGKQNPSIFVYNIVQNTILRVYGIEPDIYPTYPMFDENSKGILFCGVKMPYKKLALVFCLNR